MLLMMAGCGKKATYIKADADSITLSRTGGSDSLMIHSDGNEFSILSSTDWVKSEMRDSLLLVRVEANPEKRPRTGHVVIANGDHKISLNVIQSAPATYLTVGAKTVSIPQNGEKVELKVETDGTDVRLEGVEGVKSSFNNGILTLTGAGNTGKTRKTKGTVVCDSLSKPLLVIERGTVCSRCNGTGRVTCTWCGGVGEVYCPWDICRECNRSGKVACPECHGKGK